MNKLFNFIVIVVLGILGTSLISAQSLSEPSDSRQTPAVAASSQVVPNLANQGIAGSLANLPEADTLIFINPQRVLNEVVPKLMPAKDVAEMRKGFESVKSNFGVDPTKVEFIVLAVRFRKPTAELRFQPPEFLMISSGDFSSDSLLVLARMFSQGQLRDEKYGTKTLGLMTIPPIAKEAEKNPFLKNFAEVGIAALNANTIAAGTPAYLRAAIDAGEGKERISAEAVNLLVRDPQALISIAGRPWHSFAKSFGMMGTEATARAPRCDSRIGDFYAALTMDANNFVLRGAMNEDNPDTAKIMANLLNGLLSYATSSIKDPKSLTLLQKLALTAEGDEIVLRADFPQQMVIEMVREQMKPKKVEPATTQPAPKPATNRRRTRRRT